jgi:hypothetical protein
MTRVLALLVTLFPAVTLTLAEDQSRSNKSEESNPFSVELPILKQDLSGDRLAPEAPGAAVARLEAKLEEAKRDAKGVEGLCKRGVLSKLEMEQRLLNVIQCISISPARAPAISGYRANGLTQKNASAARKAFRCARG